MESAAKRAAREQYPVALDRISSMPSDCFFEFAEHTDLSNYAKERMTQSLVSELSTLKAQKEACEIIEVNRGRIDPRRLTVGRKFRYRR